MIEEAQQSAQSFRLKPQEEANRMYATCLEDLQLLVDMVDQMLRLREGVEDGGSQPKKMRWGVLYTGWQRSQVSCYWRTVGMTSSCSPIS